MSKFYELVSQVLVNDNLSRTIITLCEERSFYKLNVHHLEVIVIHSTCIMNELDSTLVARQRKIITIKAITLQRNTIARCHHIDIRHSLNFR